jgi:flagellar biosynthetic protein FliQ
MRVKQGVFPSGGETVSEAEVINIGRQAVQVALMVALPMLSVSLLVGLLVSLFQVATSLQDVTLTFVPKIVAVGVTLVLAAHWIFRVLLGFTQQLFQDIGRLVG